MKPIIYVASPYSIDGKGESTKEKLEDMKRRFEAVNHFVAYCQMNWADKYLFFGPISSSHPVAKYMPPEMNCFAFWVEKVDKYWLEYASEIWVLMLDKWDESKGVQYEIEFMRELNKPIKYFYPDTYEESNASYIKVKK